MSKKHDLTGIHIYDKREKEIPNLGFISVWDAETGKTHYVNTASKKVRRNYKAYFLKNLDYFKTVFAKNGSGTISTRTDQDYVKQLLGYFKNK